MLARPLRLDVIERAVIIYTNAGILVIPLVNALLGADYVIYSCAFLVIQQILIWTHCRSLLCNTGGMEWRKILLNINIIAIAIGCALFLLRIELPAFINQTLNTLDRMLGPLGMLLAGMVIADTPLRGCSAHRAGYLAAALRLLFCPLLTVLLLRAVSAADLIADARVSDDRLSGLHHTCLCHRHLAGAAVRPGRGALERALCAVHPAFHRHYAAHDWRIRLAGLRCVIETGRTVDNFICYWCIIAIRQ